MTGVLFRTMSRFMAWLEALLGLLCGERFVVFLFQCAIGSVQERTSPCELVLGSSWQPCPDKKELLDVLALGEANPSRAVVLRPWRIANLTSLHASVF